MIKKIAYHHFISSVFWNILLISVGSLVFGIGLKAIALPQGFVTGGLSGAALLVYYVSGWLSPGVLYLLINIPVFIVGWISVSRRFFFYSLYGMGALALVMDVIPFVIPIKEPMLAVLAGGVLMGAGAGIILHSLGSSGGMDIIAIILNQRFGVRMGSFFFAFNAVLFGFSFSTLETDLVLYSLFMSFISSQALEYMLSIFNQRRLVLIISDKNDEIAREIKERLNRGATFINGEGAYTGQAKKIILTVVHIYQQKRLEEAALTIDPNAFIITENTLNVLGKGFSKRKVY